jgi:non-heme chloroperoxidase
VIRSVELPNGVMLPYVEQGDPSGVPVLLLHGFVDSWRSFELLLPHLPPSIRAIALTQRGHGDASRPATGYHSHDLAADLAAFMDALRIESGVIAGASSGGIVAQRFAIDHPERTRGLVLIGSPITLRGKPGPLALWESILSKLEDPVDPGFVREFQESTLAQSVPQAFLQSMIQESLKVPARVWRAATEALIEDDHTGELNKIVAPTLILWGDSDVLTRGDQETLATAIVGSRLVVYPGGGHTLYWEQPDRVASDLVAFVEGLAIHPGGSGAPWLERTE